MTSIANSPSPLTSHLSPLTIHPSLLTSQALFECGLPSETRSKLHLVDLAGR